MIRHLFFSIPIGLIALSGCNSGNRCEGIVSGDALSITLRELESSDYKIGGEEVVWSETQDRHSASTLPKPSFNVSFVVHNVGEFASVGNDLPLYIVDVDTLNYTYSLHIFADCGVNWTKASEAKSLGSTQ